MPNGTVEVKNFDEMRLGFRKEISRLSTKLQETMKMAQSPKMNVHVAHLTELINVLIKMAELLATFDFKPNVTVPEITIPEIRVPDITIPEIKVPSVYVPPANVNVSPADVNIDIQAVIDALEPLKYLSDRPNKPLSVRMTDGQKFVKAIQELKQSNEKLGVTFAGSSGISKDEYKAAERELEVEKTRLKKYYTNAGAVTDGIIWSPTSGKRWVITDMILNVSAAATVTVEDDLAGGDEVLFKMELAANGGFSKHFEDERCISGEVDADLLITTNAGNVYVTVWGYEK